MRISPAYGESEEKQPDGSLSRLVWRLNVVLISLIEPLLNHGSPTKSISTHIFLQWVWKLWQNPEISPQKNKIKENEHDNNTIFSLGVYTAREDAADVSEVIFTCVSSELYFLHLFKDANTLGETESTGEQQNQHRDSGMSPGYVRYLTDKVFHIIVWFFFFLTHQLNVLTALCHMEGSLASASQLQFPVCTFLHNSGNFITVSTYNKLLPTWRQNASWI